MKKIIVVLFSWFATANLWAFDNVKLSLDWVPQGEHGGYFQAIAKGYYAEPVSYTHLTLPTTVIV